MDKEVFTDPFRRSALFLTFINGKDVDDWVDQQRSALLGATTSEEQQWKDLKKVFKESFTDTGEKLEAHQKLNSLHITGGDIDSYISTFNQLIKVAGYTTTDLGTILKFRQGLNPKLLSRLIMLPSALETLEEWQKQAREQQLKYMEAQHTMGQKFGTAKQQLFN